MTQPTPYTDLQLHWREQDARDAADKAKRAADHKAYAKAIFKRDAEQDALQDPARLPPGFTVLDFEGWSRQLPDSEENRQAVIIHDLLIEHHTHHLHDGTYLHPFCPTCRGDEDDGGRAARSLRRYLTRSPGADVLTMVHLRADQ